MKTRVKHKQRGVTLLEVIISLGILGTVVLGVNNLVEQYTDRTRVEVAAQHMTTIGNAGRAYIKDNFAAVQSVATNTTPALIKVSTLISAGYLPTGFSVANNFSQNVCILVLEPTADSLNAIVVSEGGATIDDISLGSFAASIGAAGGGMYSTDTTNIRGAMGGWQFAKGNFVNANALGQRCDGTTGAVTISTGHAAMALWFADGDTTTAYLHRDSITGQPQLNTMNTPLIMGDTKVSGVACTTNGAISKDATGAVLSCQSGTWQQQGSAYWKDPVASKAALDALTCNATIAGQTRVVTTPSVGTGARAYTCNGSAWQALAIDDSGNLVVSGTATIDKLAGNLQVTSTATDGTACSGEGRLATSTSTSGLILSCQSGVWRSLGGSGLGENQTWQYPGRSMGTDYENTTGKPIQVLMSAGGGSGSRPICYIHTGAAWMPISYSYGANSAGDSDTHYFATSFVVPNNTRYYCSGGSLVYWAELR